MTTYKEKFQAMEESLYQDILDVLNREGRDGDNEAGARHLVARHDWSHGPTVEIPSIWMKHGKPGFASADVTTDECEEIMDGYAEEETAL